VSLSNPTPSRQSRRSSRRVGKNSQRARAALPAFRNNRSDFIVGPSDRVPMMALRRMLWTRPYEFVKMSPGATSFVSNPLSDQIGNFVFRFSVLLDAAALSSQFQFYRIQRVSLVYKPLITEVNYPSTEVKASEVVVPNVFVSDNHYSSTYSTCDQLKSRGDVRVVSSIQAWSHSVTPNPLLRGYDSVVSDGFINMGPQWLSTSQTDVPHYGIVIGIEPTSTTAAEFGGALEVYYHLRFRNPI